MTSTFDSHAASSAGAFLESAAHARGVPGSSGLLVFGGGFTTFGAATHGYIAVYDEASGSYGDNSIWGADIGVRSSMGVPRKVAVYQNTVYVGAGDGSIWRCNKPGWTQVIVGPGSGNPVLDMCVWQGYLVIARQHQALRLWDGASETMMEDAANYPEGLPSCESLGVVTVGGVERLAFLWCLDLSPDFDWQPGYTDDGSTWTYGTRLISAGGSTSDNARRWCESSGEFYFIRDFEYAVSGSSGTNKMGQCKAYDPTTNTLATWQKPNPPGQSTRLPTFNITSSPLYNASLATVGGTAVVIGEQTQFSPTNVTFTACDRSVKLVPSTFGGTGDAVSSVGGFLSIAATIFEAGGDRIFVGPADHSTAAVVTQNGGGTISGGASLRLATFDGATWEAWPDQPNGGVWSVTRAASLTI